MGQASTFTTSATHSVQPVATSVSVSVHYCPDSLFSDPKLQLESSMNDMVTGGYQLTGADRWAARGAINAGFAVFLYLDELVKGHVSPKPSFNLANSSDDRRGSSIATGRWWLDTAK